ncbi:hypothetical protein LCGC14_3046090 [marine sediment metagenome]|uniref:Uncharacterized protein n=1 Tax=marine sediment metagenome TaxID=412755 RepID=A0A0F8ZE10_9ZZZZ
MEENKQKESKRQKTNRDKELKQNKRKSVSREIRDFDDTK